MARYALRNPEAIKREMAKRARQYRLRQNLTQVQLAERAGISTRSLQRFEADGSGSVDALVAIAFALDAAGPIELLFQAPQARSIDEFLGEDGERRKRARGAK